MPTYSAWPNSTNSVTDLQDETTNPASTVDAHLKVTDSDDGTYIAQIDDRAAVCTAEFVLDSDMDNALTIDDMTCTLRCELHGNWNDDTLTLSSRIIASDGSTPLSDLIQFCAASEMTTGAVVDYTFPLTGLVTDPAQWANNQFWLRWDYSRSKGADGIYISCKQVTLTGNYTQAAPTQQMEPENIVQQSDIVQSSITQEHVLNPDHISQQSQIEESQAAQEHKTTAEHISQQSEIVESAVVIPILDVEGEHISQQGEIVQGVVTQYIRVSQVVEIISDIITHEVVGQHVVETPAIQQSQVTAQADLVGENIVQQSAIQQSAISPEYNLLPLHIQQEGQIAWSVVEAISNLIGEHISQQSEIEQGAIEGSSELDTLHIQQRSAIQLCQVSLEHNTSVYPLVQQSEIQQSVIGASGELIPTNISQQSAIEQAVLIQEHLLSSENIEQQSEIQQSSVDFAHKRCS